MGSAYGPMERAAFRNKIGILLESRIGCSAPLNPSWLSGLCKAAFPLPNLTRASTPGTQLRLRSLSQWLSQEHETAAPGLESPSSLTLPRPKDRLKCYKYVHLQRGFQARRCPQRGLPALLHMLGQSEPRESFSANVKGASLWLSGGD